MLYYRLYKIMKKKLGYQASAFIPLDYGLFAIIIPMAVGSIIGLILENFGIVSQASAFLVMVSFVVTAAVYIQVCEWKDKGS